MSPSSSDPYRGRDEPSPSGGGHVDTFRPRWSPLLAMAWYVVAVLVAVETLLRAEGRTLVASLAGLGLATVVVYALAHRPAVISDDRGVEVRNIVRDVFVPWHLVSGFGTRWSLSVETADPAVPSIGSWAVTAKNPARPQLYRRRGMLGFGPAAPGPDSLDDDTGLVSTRLTVRQERAARLRAQSGDVPDGTVERRWVWPVIASAAGLALVLLVAVLV